MYTLDRKPTLKDCNSRGECWWWRTDGIEEVWELLVYDFNVLSYNERSPIYKYTCWAPYWAIPDPNSK